MTVTAAELEQSDNRECCVCLEPHTLGSCASRLPCGASRAARRAAARSLSHRRRPLSSGHIFHRGCLVEWLERHCTCPVCRYELQTDDADYEQGRVARMADRRPRVTRAQLDGMGVRALRDLLRAAGESDRGCVERADLVARVAGSRRIDVVAAPPPRRLPRRALLAPSGAEGGLGVRALLTLAAELGIERPPGVAERGDIIAFILASGRVELVDDDGGGAAAPAAPGVVVRSGDAAAEAKPSATPGRDEGAAAEAKPSATPPLDEFARARDSMDPRATTPTERAAAPVQTGMAADDAAALER